jgi:type IV pilus assembly protein PilN
MIRINLLPFRAARKQENVKRQISIFSGSIFLIVLALIWFNGTLGDKIRNLEDSINKAKNEVTKYQAAVKEIEEIKKELEILNKKIEVISNLEKKRQDAVRLLDNMSRLVVAKRMWFTDFEEKGANLTVKGIAIDNKTIADFMTRLGEYYSAVNLKSLQQKKVKSLSLKTFHIVFKNKPPKKTASGKDDKKA